MRALQRFFTAALIAACAEGLATSSGCTCAAPRAGENGACVTRSSSTTICAPPGGCSSAPAAGWLALPLAARRRRA